LGQYCKFDIIPISFSMWLAILSFPLPYHYGIIFLIGASTEC
jgi:hypothetical protein